jgi:hypothetical protein
VRGLVGLFLGFCYFFYFLYFPPPPPVNSKEPSGSVNLDTSLRLGWLNGESNLSAELAPSNNTQISPEQFAKLERVLGLHLLFKVNCHLNDETVNSETSERLIPLPRLIPILRLIPTLCSNPEFGQILQQYYSGGTDISSGLDDDISSGLDDERFELYESIEFVAFSLFKAGYDTSKARLAINQLRDQRDRMSKEEALAPVPTTVEEFFKTFFPHLDRNCPQSISEGVDNFLEAVGLCEALESKYSEHEKKVIRVVLWQGTLVEKLQACENFLRPHLEGSVDNSV